MSVSLLEVIEHSGYNIGLKEDAEWFLSKQAEFAELVEQAENLLEEIEDQEYEEQLKQEEQDNG